MISPCYYTHPDSEKVLHLEPHGAGRVFPYNPEFYDLASGLYGPGSYYCWHVVILSIFVGWATTPKDEYGVRRPRISADLLAMVTSSVFAATDVLIQTLTPWGTPDRALAIFCLRFPSADLSLYGEVDETQIDFTNIPPEILNLGQRAVSITGPLTICYTFGTAFLILVLVSTDAFSTSIEPTRWAMRLLYGAYGYLCLSLTVFHLSLWDFPIATFMILYESLLPISFIAFYGLLAVFAIGYLCALGMLVMSIVNWKLAVVAWILKVMGIGLFGVAMIAALVFELVDNEYSLVPDLGISLAERDQLAALMVGTASLLVTLYQIWSRWKATLVSLGEQVLWEMWNLVSGK